MAFYGRREPPALKKGVDIQLQSAFADENWPTVLRLADRRLKASGDAYYDVLKACAEAQLDGMGERAAAAVAVDAMVRSNTTPADLEAIELLEWACAAAQLPPPPPGPQPAAAADATAVFSQTFGTLRLRWVKANARRVKECTACLQACLQHWDLVNAQQIAAVLDKSSNASDRRFLYWNILLTHMLSTSPQCPPAKRKIYGMLAQKQLEKAAEPAEAQGLSGDPALPARALRDEEDFLLYFRVLAAHGTPANYRQRALHARVGAAAQFVALGRKQLFLEVLAQLEAAGDWDAVFGLCQRALGETPDGAPPGPPTLGCDLRIWKSFLAAAQRQTDTTSAFDQVQDLLDRFVSAEPKLPPMYAKNTGLALLLTVFSLPPSLLPPSDTPANAETPPLSPRVAQLLLYIDAHLDKSAVFGDVKPFVEQLPFAEAAALIDRLAADSAADEKTDAEADADADADPRDPSRPIQRTVLLHKLRYLVLSHPATSTWPRIVLDSPAAGKTAVRACKFCGQAVDGKRTGGSCAACLTALATESLELHRRLSADTAGFVRAVLPRLDKDPRVDLTLVAVSCLLRLGGLARRPRAGARRWYGPGGGGAGGGAAHVLRAALLLDAQQRQTPDDAGLRLVLVRVLVRLGSCAAATVLARLWQPLDVKNAILDALGPLFYDRLATVAPGLFQQSRQPLLAPLHAYFGTVLRSPAPVKVWDAFAAGSYSSILDMAAYQGQLQRSCTRAMAVVEERRVARLFGAKLEDVAEVSIFADITPHTRLVNATDTGPLPNLEHSANPALADMLMLGPGLSNTRMHLGLLAEQFLDAVHFVPAKDYKPARPGDAAAADRAFLCETLDVLQSALQDALHAPGARAQLTAAEHAHATVVAALATLAAISVAPGATSPPPAETLALLAQTVTSMLGLLRSVALPPDGHDNNQARTLDALLCDVGNLHALALLRDAAVATKQTAAFLLALHERETARGGAAAGLPSATLAHARPLQTAATQALAAAKAHVKGLQTGLGAAGWLDRVGDAVAGTATDNDECAGTGTPSTEASATLARAVVDAVGGPAAVEDWAGQVLDGWRDTAKGWGGCVWE